MSLHFFYGSVGNNNLFIMNLYLQKIPLFLRQRIPLNIFTHRTMIKNFTHLIVIVNL